MNTLKVQDVNLGSSMHYPIAIIGHGLIGATTAALLSQLSLPIILIDQNAVPTDPSTEWDHRVSAISLHNRHLFESLGVWSTLTANRLAPYLAMTVWDHEGSAEVNFYAHEIAQPHLGYIVENRLLQQSLLQHLQGQPNVNPYYPAEIVDCVLSNGNSPHRLRLSTSSTANASVTEMTCDLLIGADGAHSWLRKQAHFQIREKSYAQKAIVATIHTEKPHQFTAWQCFSSSGPLAVLPLAEPNTASIVWSLDIPLAHDMMQASDTAFNAALTRAFDNRLGELSLLQRRFDFPLAMRHATQYVKPKLVLLGDAAHTIHPLAGLGANLGFQDAEVLYKVIQHAQNRARDFSALYTLKKYERARFRVNQEMIWLMQGFKSLFGSAQLYPTLMRNLGMKLFDRFSLLKQQVILKATGLQSGELGL